MTSLQRTATNAYPADAYPVDREELEEVIQRTDLFHPEVLKTAMRDENEAEKQQQLMNWRTGLNPSIFIQWVPDELTEEETRRRFEMYGDIDRVEFVFKIDNETGKRMGRMLFIHFFQFYETAFELLDKITEMHPAPAETPLEIRNKYGNIKTYQMKCRINMRPVPKTEYNCSQLTDMFERLKAEILSLRKEVAELKKQNETKG
jgi:hypothetical protein